MTPEDLERALDPVREHFSSKDVTPNTVLAAHLRAIGVQPVGAAWQLAKRALLAGEDFAAAARKSVGRASTYVEDDYASPRVTLGDPRPPTVEDSRPADPPSATRSEAEHRPVLPGWKRREPASRRETNTDETLDWFPKVFGPGDIDGDGAKRLLGTPNIPIVSVLVRETAQNSWDARTGSAPLRFTIHLRPLERSEQTTLRAQVITGDAVGLGVREALAKGELWVLEISDRGTRGLGGPVRNDLEVVAGATTDFIDLIMNIGAPRDVHLGAGTYGFGKTVAYQASSCGSVVFWSRAFEGREIEDRLIVSAIGPSFAREGRRFTGRHWWGRTQDSGERVEPLRGTSAANLARGIFADDYEPGETGTSIMILDPVLGGVDRDEDARRLVDSVVWHLWPKLCGAPPGADDAWSGRTPMIVEVLLDGRRLSLPEIETHTRLGGFADALNLVRRTQSGEQYTPRFNTEIFEVHCHRPQKLLGHLALSRFPSPRNLAAPDDDEIAVFTGHSSHVVWMRHDAELVVHYDQKAKLDADGLQWAGVFKPIPSVDDSFAAAEPPAHDDWVPDSMSDRAMKRDVRVALNRIRELVRDFLAPMSSTTTAPPVRSVAALADSLSGLVGATTGSGAGRKQSGGEGRRGSRKPQVRIVSVDRRHVSEGRTQIALCCLMVTNGNGPARPMASVGVGIEGGSDESPDLVELVGWSVHNPHASDRSASLDDTAPTLSDGEEVWLVVESSSDVAVDVNVTATVAD